LPLAEPEPSPLVDALVQRGVTRATAVDLAQQHPAERIEQKREFKPTWQSLFQSEFRLHATCDLTPSLDSDHHG
jgi:hypothetical protein